MARIVSVDDQFNLPQAVKVGDANLPAASRAAAIAAKLDANKVGAANGVASLGADGKVSDATIPATIVRTDDPGIPEDGPLQGDAYLSTVLSPTNKLLMGIRRDGSVEIPVGLIGGVLHRAGGAAAADPYDVFIVAGQSNATNLDALPADPEDADPRIRRWNANTNVIEAMPANAVYIGSTFAREYLRKQPPGRRVLIVDAAVGATGFTSTSLATPPAGYHTAAGGTWDRTLTSDPINLYSRMISRTQAAITAAGAGARLVAMLWVQGEDDTVANSYMHTDPSGPQVAYAAKLDDLISSARTALNAPALPVIVGSMTPYFIYEFATGATIREKVNYAHLDTPRRVTSSAFVWGPENLERQGDTIHLSAQGNMERGELFFEALSRAKLNLTTGRPIAPQNLRATRSGDTVKVRWDAAPSRATAYVVEYSINAGAWTALTLPVPLALSGTFTAAATSPVKLRARTTNEVGTSHNTLEVAI